MREETAGAPKIDTRVPRDLADSAWRQLLFGGLLAQVAWFWTLVTTAVTWAIVVEHGGLARMSLAALPFVGVVALVALTSRGLTHAHLARRGYRTRGRRVAFEETGISFGAGSHLSSRNPGKPVYQLTFEFDDHRDQPRRVSAYTPEPSHLTDEPLEEILYDPDRPTRAALVDHLPGDLRIDPTNTVVPRDGGSAWGVVLLPLATLVVNLGGALLAFLGA